ncbi:hemolysin family protein [Sinorhizobium medicae]|uniref:Hemolysin n=2 Tax=Sinorhizobium medicae TaxID=110321 RepID=A0ABX4TGG3_9HYPH|nr:hemolysin family protein [Sinorhizobium medicae]PLT99051.1 hemolysin [Sinorhizobium medicae]PLU77233.1 hemolysin [Sinorhizobium medicae]
MPDSDGSILDLLGILAVFILVLANGFFVAAEFSLVAVRRSRVAELVAAGRLNAKALQRAVDHLDANLAATQLGITISSLALGWIGEPALSHLIEPALAAVAGSWTEIGAHAIAITVAFSIITTLHIVLGELAPKSLALQRSESTALWVVRPLGLFRVLLWPAIFLLNGLGNQLLRLAGLRAGSGEEALHSSEELKMLITASGRAGLLHDVQREVVERIFSIASRRISDFMTPRPAVVWIDAEDSLEDMLKTVRDCHHEQIVVSRGDVDEVIGVVRKQDLLDQALDGRPFDPLALVKEALVVPEGTPVLTVFEQFKRRPIRMAMIVDEYGSFEGIVTQTDLLEAIAGDIPNAEDHEPEVVEQDGGSLLMDGRMLAEDAFDRLQIQERPECGDFHTLAGFALLQFRRIPATGDHFNWKNWRFEVVAMDGRRIGKLRVSWAG